MSRTFKTTRSSGARGSDKAQRSSAYKRGFYKLDRSDDSKGEALTHTERALHGDVDGDFGNAIGLATVVRRGDGAEEG